MNSVQIIGLRGGFSFEEAVAHFTGMGGEVVLFDPSVVCGKDHILSAVRHAERAFRVGNNRAKNILTETVLYAAGERQIGRALEKMKPKSSGGMVAAVFDIDDLALERLGAARDDSLCDASEEKARNVGAEMFDGVSPEDAVLEMVANVDLLKP